MLGEIVGAVTLPDKGTYTTANFITMAQYHNNVVEKTYEFSFIAEHPTRSVAYYVRCDPDDLTAFHRQVEAWYDVTPSTQETVGNRELAREWAEYKQAQADNKGE